MHLARCRLLELCFVVSFSKLNAKVEQNKQISSKVNREKFTKSAFCKV